MTEPVTEAVTEEVVVRQKKPRSEAQRAQFEAARQKAWEMRKQYAAARKERDTQAVLTVLQDGELKPKTAPPTEAPVTEAPTEGPATAAPATEAPEDEPEEEVVQISRSAKPKKKVSRRKIVVVEQSSSSSSDSEVEVVVPKRPPPAAQPSAQEMMVQRMTNSMFYL